MEQFTSEIDVLRQRFPLLMLESGDSRLVIGTSEWPAVLEIEADDGFVLRWNAWHAPVDSVAEALDLAVLILSGSARVMNQMRGDTLAVAWLDIADGDGFVRDHESMFLNPFDQGEWTLAAGEQWEVIASYAYLVDDPDSTPIPEAAASGYCVRSERVDGYVPVLPDPWMSELLKELMGVPPAGWRWTSVRGNEIGFALPFGVRHRDLEEPTERILDLFTSEDGGTRVFLELFFSPPDPQPIEPGSAIAATSVEEQPLQETDGWRLYVWDLQFEGPHERLWARFSVQIQAVDESGQSFAEQFGQEVRNAKRLVPPG